MGCGHSPPMCTPSMGPISLSWPPAVWASPHCHLWSWCRHVSPDRRHLHRRILQSARLEVGPAAATSKSTSNPTTTYEDKKNILQCNYLNNNWYIFASKLVLQNCINSPQGDSDYVGFAYETHCGWWHLWEASHALGQTLTYKCRQIVIDRAFPAYN